MGVKLRRLRFSARKVFRTQMIEHFVAQYLRSNRVQHAYTYIPATKRFPVTALLATAGVRWGARCFWLTRSDARGNAKTNKTYIEPSFSCKQWTLHSSQYQSSAVRRLVRGKLFARARVRRPITLLPIDDVTLNNIPVHYILYVTPVGCC